MANDDGSELQEIVDHLPPRFREISATSTTMERFNLMNNDLISDRIIPALHTGLRSLIPNARPGLIANRLRHLVDSAPPSSRQRSLRFHVLQDVDENVSEIKFLDCAIRDKRLPPFTNHELEIRALTIPHMISDFEWLVQQPFVEAIGHKVVFWTRFDPRRPFCYIMNAGNNSDGAFRALDTSTLGPELPGLSVSWTMVEIVGDRLIVFLVTPRSNAAMLFLDVNTERWSVLPECPILRPYYIPILWKGKLYLADRNRLVSQPTDDDVAHVVPMHFDFQRNVWVLEDDVNTDFARRLMQLPSNCFNYDGQFGLDKVRFVISSKSGTLYAVTHNTEYENPIGVIYAMDDLTTGWRRIECQKSVHTKQVHPFRLPYFPRRIGDRLETKIKCWEINERDILLVVLHTRFSAADGLWARYAWWTFNEDDGVKSSGVEELSRSGLQNAYNLSVLKIGF
jgi:hypothetical protein